MTRLEQDKIDQATAWARENLVETDIDLFVKIVNSDFLAKNTYALAQMITRSLKEQFDLDKKKAALVFNTMAAGSGERKHHTKITASGNRGRKIDKLPRKGNTRRTKKSRKK